MALKAFAVTGASGFIGRHICARIAREGFAVRAVSRGRSVQECTKLERADRVVVDSYVSSASIKKYLDGVDCVIHCAGASSARQNRRDTWAYCFEANVELTAKLALEAAGLGVKKFVFLSSAKVHGETTREGVFIDEDSPFAPVGPYATSKARAEDELRRIQSSSSMSVVIMRPPLVYGPGVRGHLNRLISMVRFGIPLPFAQSSNKRSMIGVNNLVDAIFKSSIDEAARDRTFIVSDSEEVSLAELIGIIARTIGVRARLFNIAPDKLESVLGLVGKKEISEKLFGNFQVRSLYAHGILGWRAPFSLEREVLEMVRRNA